MKQIETYEEELVQILSPNIIKQFNTKFSEIEVNKWMNDVQTSEPTTNKSTNERTKTT